MDIYTKILGNSHSKEWSKRLLGASIDYIELDQWNAQKSRLLAMGTSGKPYPMAFKRGVKLTDGDIIAYDPAEQRAAVIRLRLGDVMVINLSGLAHKSQHEATATAIELGHALGNQHWAVLQRGDSLLVPLTVDKKVMLSVMRTHNFEGIEFSFHPGSELIPYLSPSEIRRLFGATAPEDHSSHNHAPHDHHLHSPHQHLNDYV